MANPFEDIITDKPKKANPFADIITDKPQTKTNPFEDVIPSAPKSMTIPSGEQVGTPAIQQDQSFGQKAKEFIGSTLMDEPVEIFGKQIPKPRIEFPFKVGLYGTLPASMGTGLGVKALTGGALGLGGITAEKLVTEGRLPTLGEAAINTFGSAAIPVGGKIGGEVIKQFSKAPAGKAFSEITQEGPKAVNKLLQQADIGTEPLEKGLQRTVEKSANPLAAKVTPKSLLGSVKEGAVREGKYIGRTINLNRFDKPQEVKDFFTNAVDQIPESQLPKEVITFKDFDQLAQNHYGLTFKQLIRNSGHSLKGDIRRAWIKTNLAMDAADKQIDDAFSLAVRRSGELKQGLDNLATKEELAISLHDMAFLSKEAGSGASELGRGLSMQRMIAKGARAKKRVAETIIKTIESKGASIDEVAEKMASLDINDPRQVYTFIRGFTKATTRQKINFVYINGLLSGLSNIKNITSNALFFIAREGQRPLAAGVDAIRNPLNYAAYKVGLFSERIPRQRFFGESLEVAYGIRQGAPAYSRAAVKAFITEMPTYGGVTRFDLPTQMGRAFEGPTLIPKRVPIVGGTTLGGVIGLPGRLMMTADEFFKGMTKYSDVHARAFRQASQEGLEGIGKAERIQDLIGKAMQEETDDVLARGIKEAAENEMLYRTFQKQSDIADIAINTRQRTKGALDPVLPFIKTGVNLGKAGLENTPPNLLRATMRTGILGQRVAEKSGGLITGGALSDELAKGITGLGIAMGLASLIADGRVTGGLPKSPAEKAVFYKEGKQPYAIRIGDEWYSYGWIEPVGSSVGLIADYMLNVDLNDPADAMMQIMESMGRNLTSKTYLESLSNMFDAMSDPDRYGRTFVEKLTGGIIPTGVAHIARSTDPNLRDPDGVIQNLMSRLPGLRQKIKPIRDIYGKPVTDTRPVLERMFSPFPHTTQTDDPLTSEIVRLSITRYMGKPKDIIEGLKLTEEQYDQYVAEAGQLAYENGISFVNSRLYQHPDFTDEDKTKAIVNIFRKAREQTRNNIKQRYGLKKIEE